MNAIECEGVSKHYAHFTLNDIDLTVPTGTVMGFVGPNGAGKSTTLRILMGLVRQDSGRVSMLGHLMPAEQIAAKWNIGYVSDDMRLHPSQTIAFHLDFIRSIFPTWDARYAAHLLEVFHLEPSHRVKGLSHGERVKAALLLAFARRPKLLVLDEPTTGLDPLARHQVLDEMSAVLADESRTILFSSHNTLDVEQISDQITFINDGSIVFSKDKESLLEDWRRIRLQIGDDFRMPDIAGVMSERRHGHLAIVETRQFCDSARVALTQAGAKVEAVERMTLEEIFLTSVAAGRRPSSEDPS